MDWAHATGGTLDVDLRPPLDHEELDNSTRPSFVEAEWAVIWGEGQVMYLLSTVS